MLSSKPLTAPTLARPTDLHPLFQAVKPAPVALPAAPRGFIPNKEELDPTRILAMKCALVMLFVRMAVVPEVIATVLGIAFPVLYLVSPPAMMGCLFTGGFGRAFSHKSVVIWTLFFLILVAAVPFSSWVGLSFQTASTYARANLICVYVIAGTVLTMGEIEKAFKVMAWAGAVVLAVAFKYALPDAEGRLSLDFGEGGGDATIANSNDLSAHVLLLLPFMTWYAFQPNQKAWIRYPMIAGMGYSVWVILGTSSRGAMAAMFLVAFYLFLRSNANQKAMIMLGLPAITAILFAVLPPANVARLVTLFGISQDAGISAEAEESRQSRQYLVEQSIKFTLENPVFGIGPGNFSNYEGMMAAARGEQGNWHETHNSWTECSSECGVPALICFVGGLVAAFVAVGQTYSRAAKVVHGPIMRICVTYQAAMVGYLVCLTFLASAYRFTLPALIGMGAAIHYAGNRLLDYYTAGDPTDFPVVGK